MELTTLVEFIAKFGLEKGLLIVIIFVILKILQREYESQKALMAEFMQTINQNRAELNGVNKEVRDNFGLIIKDFTSSARQLTGLIEARAEKTDQVIRLMESI